MTDRLTPGQLRDLADLIWGRDLPTPPNDFAATVQIEIAEGLRNSAARREAEADDDDRNRVPAPMKVVETVTMDYTDAPPPPAPIHPHDGNRPLPIDRETLGRMVREAWARWAETQPSPKPSWLVPYDELSEPDKEADRQIGEAVARWTLIHDAARLSLADAPPPNAPEDAVKALAAKFAAGVVPGAKPDDCLLTMYARIAIEALRADLRLAITERDKTFATMLARAETAEVNEKFNLERRTVEREQARETIKRLREALDALLDAVDAHNKANGKQMIDPHAEQNARAALAQGESK